MGHMTGKASPVLGVWLLLSRSCHPSVSSLPSVVIVIVNAMSLSEHLIKTSEHILMSFWSCGLPTTDVILCAVCAFT